MESAGDSLMKLEKTNAWILFCAVFEICMTGVFNIYRQVQAGNVPASTFVWHCIYLVIGWVLAIFIIRKRNVEEVIDKLGIKSVYFFGTISLLIMIIRWLVPDETYTNYRIGFAEMHVSTWLVVIILYMISVEILTDQCPEKAWIYILVYEASICLLLHGLIRFHVGVAACLLITAIAAFKKGSSSAKFKYLGYASLCAAILYLGTIILWKYHNPLYDQNFNIYLWMEALRMDVDIDGALKAVSLSDDALTLLFTQSWKLGMITIILFILLVVLLLLRVCCRGLSDYATQGTRSFGHGDAENHNTGAMREMICVLLAFIILCNLLKNTTGFFYEPVAMPFFSAAQIDNIIYLFLLGVAASLASET